MNHKSDFLDKQHSILKVLAYFSQFNYPLTKEEIIIFLDRRISSIELSNALAKLKSTRLIFQAGNFFSLKDDPSMYEQRIKGNLRAITLLQKAGKISKILYAFPFVRGVFISGSLSKNFAKEDADIDFFIITKSNRLWIARTFMHMLKKLSFIAGMQHFFCMNYYIDEESMEITEQNEFTATEIFTLVPSCGTTAAIEFHRMNDWVNFYYPNYSIKSIEPKIKSKNNLVKKICELLFTNKPGNWLDDYLMRVTTNRWKQKENIIQKNGRRIGLRTDKHFCKPNPDFFQKKLLNKYYNSLNEITKKLEKINVEEKSASLN